ncbi:MAG: hypothetical protein JOZ19_09450 [Rubrobacter sp.]|nr:hypothetical protein [Rubrobacter sp.]
MEDTLGFYALVLTMLSTISIAVWFCCSIVQNIVTTRQRLRSLRYNTLLKENERLKSILADAEEENLLLRKLYNSECLYRRSKAGQTAA